MSEAQLDILTQIVKDHRNTVIEIDFDEMSELFVSWVHRNESGGIEDLNGRWDTIGNRIP